MPRTTSLCRSLKNGCSCGDKFFVDLGHLEVSISRSLVCTGQEVHAALNSVSVTAVSANVSATSVFQTGLRLAEGVEINSQQLHSLDPACTGCRS